MPTPPPPIASLNELQRAAVQLAEHHGWSVRITGSAGERTLRRRKVGRTIVVNLSQQTVEQTEEETYGTR